MSAHSEPIEFIWTIRNFSKSIQEDECSISSDPLTLDGSHFWKFEISLASSSTGWAGDVMDSKQDASDEQLFLRPNQWINKEICTFRTDILITLLDSERGHGHWSAGSVGSASSREGMCRQVYQIKSSAVDE